MRPAQPGVCARARSTSKLGLESLDAERRAGHFLGLRFPQAFPEGLQDALRHARVYVSVRGDSLRVTPHLYNNDADVDQDDHAIFAACLNGPDVNTPPLRCTQEQFDLADLQVDQDVDLHDFQFFLDAVTANHPTR